MAISRGEWLRQTRRFGLAAGLTLALGCGGSNPEGPVADVGNKKPSVDPPTASIAAPPSEKSSEVVLPPAPADAQHQPFAKAVRQSDNPPDGAERPPDMTIAGKPVGKLYAEVVRLWDGVRFVNASGKRLVYTAVLDTEFGVVEIALRPDVAPNHVRNFIALAKAGYYDGLRFDRARHEKEKDDVDALDILEAGCPLGTGDPANNSIGYWLKPEFDDKDNPKLGHDVGVVGAGHGEEADSAACTFYITLSKAPTLDGNYTAFGKVVKGLDVARKIFMQPTIDANDGDPDAGGRPRKPVVMRKVTIQVREADAAE